MDCVYLSAAASEKRSGAIIWRIVMRSFASMITDEKLSSGKALPSLPTPSRNRDSQLANGRCGGEGARVWSC